MKRLIKLSLTGLNIRLFYAFFITTTLLSCNPILYADTHTVTNNSNSGAGSLRQALIDITDGDSIDFNLSSGNETITIASHLSPTTSKTVIIDGSNTLGSGVQVTVQVTTPGSSNFRVFYIRPDSGKTHTLKNMIIKGGNTSQGGSILLESCNGNMVIQGCSIIGSKSTNDGGGIYLNSSSSNVTIDNCLIQGCYASYGGGIYTNSGALSITITSSTFLNNTATNNGGAICTFFENMNISSSTFMLNTSTTSGGAIYMDGSSSNSAWFYGCTFSSNTAFGHPSSNKFGGAVYFYYGTIRMTNCTVCHNTSQIGGGIAISYGTMYFTNSTLANNITTALGGGFYMGSSTLYIKNTIVADNNTQDIRNDGNTIYDNGYNIVESYSGNAFNWTATGDLYGNQVNLNLSSTLAQNNSLNGLLTLALSSSSVAVDAGNAAANGSVSVPTIDQRGYSRIGGVDIGAFEYGAGIPPPVASSFTGTVLSSGSIQWNWLDVSGEDGYRIVNTTAGAVSSNLAANTTYWIEGNLTPNTTYFRSVQGYIGAFTSTSTLSGVLTYAAVPLVPQVLAISSVSASVGVLANNNSSETTYSLKVMCQGTTYYAQADGSLSSTELFQSSISTFNVIGLLPNTTYSFAIAAKDSAQRPTSYSLYSSTCTSAQVPAFESWQIHEATRLQPLYSVGNNPSGTQYNIDMSSDSSFAIITSSSGWSTENNTYIFINLSSNVTYYFRCEAKSFLGGITLPSATSLALTKIAVPQNLALPSVSSTSITVTWDSNNNGPQTVYYTELSSDNENWSNIYTGPLFTFTTSGLLLNQRYYFRTKAQGMDNSYSFYSSIASSTTWCGMSALGVGQVTTTSIAFSINAQGNSPSTVYSLKLLNSGVTYYVLQSNSFDNASYYNAPIYQTAAQWGTVTLTNLTNSTLYQLSVQARNLESINTAYSSWISTYTFASPPLAESLTPQSTYSIQSHWDANGNITGTQYLMEVSSMSNFNPICSSTSWTTDLFTATTNGLTAFTSYYFRVSARNVFGVQSSTVSLGIAMVLPDIPTLECTSGHVNSAKTNIAAVVFVATNTPNYTSFKYLWGKSTNDRNNVLTNGTSWDGQSLTVNCTNPNNIVGVRHYFEVISINPVNNISGNLTRFTVYFSTEPPRLVSAVAESTDTVVLSFNEQMSTSTLASSNCITTTTNTIITGLSISSVTAYSENLCSFTMRTSSQTIGTEYIVSVSTNLTDSFGNKMITQFSSTTFYGYGTNTKPRISYTSTPYENNHDNGKVTIPLYVYDDEQDKCKIQIYFSTVSVTGPWNKANISSVNPYYNNTLEVYYNDIYGGPIIDNAQSFQIGDLLGRSVVTYTTNTVTITWNSANDLPNEFYSTVYTSVTVSDFYLTTTSIAGPFAVDNKKPSNGAQSVVQSLYSVGPTSMTWCALVPTDDSAIEYYFSGTVGDSLWISQSTRTFNVLTPNTNYNVKVTVRDIYSNTSPQSVSVSTYTYAKPPLPVSIQGVSIYNLVPVWAANDNPGGTEYYLEISSQSLGGAVLNNSGWITGTNWQAPSLVPNTTYYIRGKARNALNIETSWVSFGSTVTMASTPDIAVLSSVGITSMTVTWTSDDPDTTLYELQESSVNTNQWRNIISGTLTSLTTTTTNLSPNTYYYYRTRTQNANGFYSNYSNAAGIPTLCYAPSNIVFNTCYASSITMQWNANTNPSWTNYNLLMSADNSNWNTRAGISNYIYTDTMGLLPNATYYYKVRALNLSGIATGDSLVVSTHTLGAVPTQLQIVSVTTQSVNISWNANNNPSYTNYSLQMSQDNSNWSNIYTGQLLTFTTSGLSLNSTYYFQVCSINIDSVYSSYCLPISTHTLASPSANVSVLLVSSVTAQVSISDGINPSYTKYSIKVSTGSQIQYVQGNNTLGATPFYQTITNWGNALAAGFTPNWMHAFSVAACNLDNVETSYSTSVSTRTDAAPPIAANFTVSSTTINVLWQANGNYLGTDYTAEETFVNTASSSTKLNSWLHSGLIPNTTYAYRVKAMNDDGEITTWTVIGTTITKAVVPPAPTVLSVSYSSESIRLNTATNPYWTEYAIGVSSTGWSSYLSASGGSFSSTPVYKSTTAWSSDGTIWFVGLSTNTVYMSSACARNIPGDVTSFGASASSATLALPVGPITLSNVSISSVTISWDSGNPEYTRFEVYTSTDSFTLNFSTPVLLSRSFTANTTSIVNLTPNTSYYFRIRSFNENDTPASFTSIVSTITFAAVPYFNNFTVNTTSQTVNVNASTNPSGTDYLIEDTTLTLSSTTALTAWPDTGLAPNTTYQYRITALGRNGFNTVSVTSQSVTLASIPSVPSLLAVQISSINVTVNIGANNPFYTEYALRITSPTAAVYVSTSGVFSATAVWADTTTWTASSWISALMPNTTYTISTIARNTALNTTAFSMSLTTSTLANDPVASGFLVFATSITANWTRNTNPVGTLFISSETFTTQSSSNTQNTYWIHTGLTPNTTYSYKVQALNYAGIPSNWVVLGSTVTDAQTPPKMIVNEVCVSSISYQINSGSNPYWTEYAIGVASGSVANKYVQADGSLNSAAVYQTTTTWTSTIWVIGLSTNTIYVSSVSARNVVGETTVFGASVSSSTLVLPITDITLPSVFTTSMTVTWTSNNPANARYEVYASTDNFTLHFSTKVVYTSNLTAGTTAIISLTPNTSYYFRVRPFNLDNVPVEYSSIVSTATYAAAPISSAFTTVFQTSVTANWQASNNPEDTQYTIDNLTISASSVTYRTNWNQSALTPNTTYLYQVKATSRLGYDTIYTVLKATTLAYVPATPTLNSVFTSSANVTIIPDPNNPYYTTYCIRISSDSTAPRYVQTGSSISTTAVFQTTTTWTSNTWITGLEINTTYYLIVNARNIGFVETPFTSTVTIVSLSNPPVAAAYNVFTTSLTVNWTSNGNQSGTIYTSSNTTLGVSSATTNLSWTNESLIPNTSYAYMVKATNFSGMDSVWSVFTETATLASLPSAPTAVNVYVSSASVKVSIGTNNPYYTEYALKISSGNGAWNKYISTDSTISSTAVFATTTTWTTESFSTSLLPNTTYTFYELARNMYGVLTSTGNGVSLITNAAIPTGLTLSDITSSSMTATWQTNNNPGNTVYQVVCSSDNFILNFSTPAQIASGLTAATTGFAFLSANTTYWVKVAAFNANNQTIGYGNAVSTVTLANVPVYSNVVVSTGSITVSWSSNGNPIDRTIYEVENITISSVSITYSTTWYNYGLTPNTTYSYRIRAISNLGVPTDWVALVSTRTNINALGALSVTSASTSTISILWSPGNNGSGLVYGVVYSTDCFVSTSTAVNFAANMMQTTTTVYQLQPNTSYWIRALSFDGTGNPSLYTNIVSTVTLPEFPTGVNWVSVSSVIARISWTDTINPDNSIYTVELSTNSSFDPITLSSTTTESALGATINGLIPNTTYYTRVVAVSWNGTRVIAIAAPSAKLTFAAVPLNISVVSVTANSANLSWGNNNNSSNTGYIVEYSSDNFISHISTAVTLNSNLRALTTTVYNLSENTTYWFRVAAYNNTQNITQYGQVASAVTLVLTPSQLVISDVCISSFSVTWNGNGNVPGTRYTVEYSLDGFSVLTTTAISFSNAFTDNTTYLYTLNANTTYWARVAAYSQSGVMGQYSSIISTITLTNPALPISIVDVQVSSLTLTINPGNNPYYTDYAVKITSANSSWTAFLSTTGAFSSIPVWASTTTWGTSVLTSNLTPATIFNFQTVAKNISGITGNYSSVVSTTTRALPPAIMSTPVVNISSTSSVLSWNSNGNPPGTTYLIECSSNNFNSVYSSSTIANTSFDFQSLLPNTSYWFKVRVAGSNVYSNLDVLITKCQNPTTGNWPQASVHSLGLGWIDTTQNPDDTVYDVQITTDPVFNYVAHSTQTVKGANNSLVTGLIPNTTYYGRVGAINRVGIASDYIVTNPPNEVTYAAQPVAVGFSTKTAGSFAPSLKKTNALSGTSLELTWNANGNPGVTIYEVSISTDGFVLDFSTPVPISVGSTQTTFVKNNLTAGTTYTARVRAINHKGYYTIASSAAYFVPLQNSQNLLIGSTTYATAYDYDNDGSYESYQSQVTSTPTYTIYGDTDTFVDYLVSITGTTEPEYYWDPDNSIVTPIYKFGTDIYLLDKNGDGIPDTKYNPSISTITVINAISVEAIAGLSGYFLDYDGAADGYEVYIDTNCVSTIIKVVEGDSDGKKDYFINTNGGSLPNKYVDPDNNIFSSVNIYDYDGNGSIDWGVDLNGDGVYDYYYKSPNGPMLSIMDINDDKVYNPGPNPFYPEQGNMAHVYNLKTAGSVLIEIYDIAGEKVAILINGYRSAGRHQFYWNGGNGEYDATDGQIVGSNRMLAKGIYIVRYQLNNKVTLKKIGVIK